jgi:2,3-bisphosphoglycerate-dependent phosphoglycerate mutase
MELYILRHGQSTNNALTNQEDRGCDPPLTDLGRQQAERLAQHLATESQRVSPRTRGYQEPGYGITHLYCSPMWRALQTAQPIGEALGLVPEVWIDIHEWGGIYLDLGEPEGVVGYPGKTRSEILEEFPCYTLPEGITENGWWNRAPEDRAQCTARAIKVTNALQERAQARADERIALVTHGGFGGLLVKALFNHLLGPDILYHHYNTAIARIDLAIDKPLHVRYLNRVDHLPPEVVT